MCHWSAAWLSAGPSTMSPLSSFSPPSLPLPGDRTSALLVFLTAPLQTTLCLAPVHPARCWKMSNEWSSSTRQFECRECAYLCGSLKVHVLAHFLEWKREYCFFVFPVVLKASSISSLITSFLMLLKCLPHPQLISSCTLFKGTALITVFILILMLVECLSLSVFQSISRPPPKKKPHSADL